MAMKVGIPSFTGTITAIERGGFFRVRLDDGHRVLARVAGRMVQHGIKLAAGDTVRCEVAAFSGGESKGRITWRKNEYRERSA
jgi:translation initiation factor IF-1